MLYATIFLLSITASGIVQSHEVSGMVTDSEAGESLSGVNILIQGTSQGTTMDLDGEYQIYMEPNEKKVFSNSLGMDMMRIESGSFKMGGKEQYKEKPIQRVHITKPFYMASTQVTNAQYEQFDTGHKKLRGKHGLSKEDDEAVIYVSWNEAVAFCEWLSEKEGVTYRLPTEAEWEYAARAGTTTRYNMGNSLPVEFHRNQVSMWGTEPVPLQVGQTTPNSWGLYDMHGLVEEWVYDWYGPYTGEEKTDPVGRKEGLIKVTRGGSHGTPVEYLRSATRMGTIPEDKNWLIGFRVVQAEMPDTEPYPPEKERIWQENVNQQKYDWDYNKVDGPYFKEPISFVNTAVGVDGPIYSRHYSTEINTGHVNHHPAVTWLDNGDLFILWFTTKNASGRGMTIAASRLKAGSDEWTEADVFFNAPGRNQTGSSLFNNGGGTLYWFNGLSVAQGYRENNALIMRTSADYGRTWTAPIIINSERNNPAATNQPQDNIDSVPEAIFTKDNRIRIFSDTHRISGGGTLVQYIDLEQGTVEFSEGTIDGIHARAVPLKDGRLLAVGRSLQNIGPDDRLPMSISYDDGNNWEHFDSEFPAISGGQRPVLMRLKEGAILLVSFTGKNKAEVGNGMLFKDENGNEYRGNGMFGAVSFDQGKTWPVRKLITPADKTTYDGRGTAGFFTATRSQAEPSGYLTATQTPDKIIHLFSSGLHYEFNLEWLKAPGPIE